MNILKKNLLFTLIFSLATLTMSLFSMDRGAAASAAAGADDAQGQGIVVVVAGPSSCGKTMVTEKLTESLNEADLYGGNWIRFSLDDVTKELDERSSSDGSDKGSDDAESDSGDEKFVPISDLSDGNQVLCQTIRDAVTRGYNVVVDTVFDEDEDKLDAFKVQLFQDGVVKSERCLTVFLYCSVETLLERVGVRNAKDDSDDHRSASIVLRVFAKMMERPKKAAAAAAADDTCLQMSPKEFDHAVRTSPVMEKAAVEIGRLLWELKGYMGLEGDESLPMLLVPKAQYDCLVRSDTHPNDQVRENVETAIDQILGRLQRVMQKLRK